MEEVYGPGKDWVRRIDRPFDLFGTSLWYRWYTSPQMKRILHAELPDMLAIEVHPGIVRQYISEKQIQRVREKVKSILIKNPGFYVKLFRKGLLLNEKADKILKIGPSYFKSLGKAVDFHIDVALHCTVIPGWVRNRLGDLDIDNKELWELTGKLRKVTYYPELIEKIIIPIAKKQLSDSGVKNSAKAIHLLTLSELTNKRVDIIEDRLDTCKKNNRFVYQVIDGAESVHFLDDIEPIIMQLERMPQSEKIELKGSVACEGKAKGIARVILKNDPKGVLFNKGDILVTINSSPSLIQFIQKSSAIVTDEGGTGCHAAVISRELNIPCVMATKTATTAIKDGDMIEVDAKKGIVRILERKKK